MLQCPRSLIVQGYAHSQVSKQGARYLGICSIDLPRLCLEKCLQSLAMCEPMQNLVA
jgi:predicted nucleic acid binding AN1-type Zn finger protein